MENKTDFLRKYNIPEKDFDKTKLDWDSLKDIYADYYSYKEELEQSAIYIFNLLMKAKNVHSVRYRIKDPEHVIEKIIRKKIENSKSNINIDNYKTELHDLIGLRALHLFKDEWTGINDYIKDTWHLKEPPVANYRKGDSDKLIDAFKEMGCSTKEHKYGYRSVHYIIETQPAKKKYLAEIQVRTIFEEAWSEIDHTVRYPYDLENIIFSQFLSILNRLAGGADEMGTFIRFLQSYMREREEKLTQKEQLITELEHKIEQMNLNKTQLKDVKSDLKKIRLFEGTTQDDWVKVRSFFSNNDFMSFSEELKEWKNIKRTFEETRNIAYKKKPPFDDKN